MSLPSRGRASVSMAYLFRIVRDSEWPPVVLNALAPQVTQLHFDLSWA